MNAVCIRCLELETSNGRPYCCRCTFQVRREIEDGLHRLTAYLAAWADFAAWEQTRR